MPASGTDIEILERLLGRVDRTTFYAVYGITKKCNWLDSRQRAFIELLKMCDNGSERELVLKLLERYSYLSGDDLEAAVQTLAEVVINEWKCVPNQSIFAAIAGDTDPDGSQAIIQSLKNYLTEADGWNTKKFFSQLEDALPKCKTNSNLVLIEDFVGTGNKVTKAIERVNEYFGANSISEVNLFILSVSAMEASRPVIDELKIKYHCVHWLKKGISDYSADDLVKEDLSGIKALSSKLSKKFKGQYMNPLGYKKSEALVYLQNISVPNNVFSIFWWPKLLNGTRRNTLFSRQR